MAPILPRNIAIAGIGMAGVQRNAGRSPGALILDACAAAIDDAGLPREHVDGVGGVYSPYAPSVWPAYVVNGLGLGPVSWSSSFSPPSMSALMGGVTAVASGLCEVALCYHGSFRWDVTSAQARSDPRRRSSPSTFDPMFNLSLVSHLPRVRGVAAAMRRHMQDHGSRREHFGMIAVNQRTNAQKNPAALFYGHPLTMEGYLASPMIDAPFSMLDMDAPMDVGGAVLVTTLERARDLKQTPVEVLDMACGVVAESDHIFQPFWTFTAARHVMTTLWGRTGLRPSDIDLALLYDGFSPLCMEWVEAAFCDLGEGAGLIADGFDADSGDLRLLGRIPLNTHGGNLSEGRVQGIGHIIEGVRQLRGQAGERQVLRAQHALVTNGSGPINNGMIIAAA